MSEIVTEGDSFAFKSGTVKRKKAVMQLTIAMSLKFIRKTQGRWRATEIMTRCSSQFYTVFYDKDGFVPPKEKLFSGPGCVVRENSDQDMCLSLWNLSSHGAKKSSRRWTGDETDQLIVIRVFQFTYGVEGCVLFPRFVLWSRLMYCLRRSIR